MKRRIPAHFRLLLLLAPGWLAACSYPRYADESERIVAMPASHGLVAPETAEASQACAFFPRGEAVALLAKVASDNFDLLSAGARLRQAEAAARAAGSPLLPRLDAQLSGSRGTGLFASSTGSGSTQGALTIYQGSVAASYELDVWGRVRNQRTAALLDAQAAAAALDSLAITLNAQTAEVWIAVLAQRQLVELLEQQLSTSSRYLELTYLRFGQGQSPAQDIGRQKQQTLSVEGELQLARAQVEILESQLALLTGTAPGLLALPAHAQFPTLPVIPAPGVPADLAGRRPDVRAALLQLEAADRRTAVAVAERLPGLNLTANLVSIEASLSDVFSDALWSAGSGLSLNLFDAGAQRARIDVASAAAEEALYAYAGTLLSALQEVNAALIRNLAQDQFATSIAGQLGEAEKVLALTRDSYRQGQGTYLEVLNALQSQQQLQRQWVNSVRQQFSNRIQLCRSLGQPVAADTMPAQAASVEQENL